MKKYSNNDLASINAISKFYNIPKSISTLLVNRGIDTEDSLEKYFNKEYKLSSPLQFPTIKKALKRLNRALVSDEKILIFGDYDVDGMVATSMIYLYLLRANANVDFFIPDRNKDGYGFNENTVKKIIEEYAPDLVISVDTGITAKKEVEDLKRSNIDVIITDHHTVQPEKIPNAVAIINPKFIKDDKHNLQDLSGGAVAFYFLRAINSSLFSEGRRQKMVDYLVLAMITSISDMMTLKGDNRILVESGLSFLFETDLLGLNLLLDSINFYDYPTAMDIGMQLSPILNSAGRIGDPNLVIQLLTDDTLNVFDKVSSLTTTNKKRKDLTKKYYNAALELLKSSEESDLVVVNDINYELGLVGLIATRLCYEKEKTVIVVGGIGDDGKRRASMRSLKGIELTPLLEILKNKIDGGGHDYALGFSVSEENLEEVIKDIKLFIKNKKTISLTESEIEISLEELDTTFMRILYSMEPFGKGNERPVIKINNIESFKETKVLKEEHFKIDISKTVSGICFFPNEELFKTYHKIIKGNLSFNLVGECFSTGDGIKIFIKELEISS